MLRAHPPDDARVRGRPGPRPTLRRGPGPRGSRGRKGRGGGSHPRHREATRALRPPRHGHRPPPQEPFPRPGPILGALLRPVLALLGGQRVGGRQSPGGHRGVRPGLRRGTLRGLPRDLRGRCAAPGPRGGTCSRARRAIRSAFRPVFEQIEAAEYRPRYEVVDVHGDRAYVLGSFDEVLRARGGTTGIRVQGRVVHFWRRLEGRWRIEMLLTGRSAPDGEV